MSAPIGGINDPVLATRDERKASAIEIRWMVPRTPVWCYQLCCVTRNSRKFVACFSVDRDVEAKVQLTLEEGMLREKLLAVIPNVQAVNEKICKLRQEIDDSITLPRPTFCTFTGALLEARARAEVVADWRRKARGLQMRNMALYREYQYLFSAHDTNYQYHTAKELKYVGYTLQELKDGGYSAQELKDSGNSLQELKDLGYSAKELTDVVATMQRSK